MFETTNNDALQVASRAALDAYSRGDFATAAERFRELMDLSEALDVPVGPVLLTNLAGCMLSLGELDEAQSVYDQALELAVKTRDLRGKGIVLSGLGYLHQRRRDLAAAIRAFESATAAFRQVNDEAEVASALVAGAGASYLNGDLPNAADAYRDALEILRRTASPAETVATLTNLGGVLYQLHEVHDAQRVLDEAVAILPEELEGSPLELSLRGNRGLAHMSLRRFGPAIEDLERARRGWEQRGEAAAQAQQLAALSDVHRWQGDLTAAIDCHQGLMELEKTDGVTVRETGGLLYTGLDDRSTWADKGANGASPGTASGSDVAATHDHRPETEQRPLLLFTPPCVGTFGPLFPRGAVALASFLNARGVPTIVVPLSHYIDVAQGGRVARDRLVSVVQQAVESLRPRAVGISVMFSYLYPQGLDIAAAVSDVDPDLPILIGGPHVTYWDRECLEEAPYVDVVIRGEGEWTALELMEALERGDELRKIRGITWRDADGNIQRNQLRSLGNVLELPEIDFGVLPPAFAGEMEVFGLSSRGCEFRCKYCHEFRYWGGSVRQYPPQRIVSEMERLWIDHSNAMRGIDDSMLNMLQPYFIDLMDQLGRSPHLPQPFGLLTRVDTISTEGLDAMKRAGIRSVSVGMESGSQKVLDAMNKEVTLEVALQGLTLTREAGIDMSCFFIVGHPGDNPTEAETTRRFVERLFEERLTNWIDAAMFTPYPGTPFFSKPERHGVKILTMDWTRWRRTNRPICELDEFSANEVYLAYLRMLRVEANAAAAGNG